MSEAFTPGKGVRFSAAGGRLLLEEKSDVPIGTRYLDQQWAAGEQQGWLGTPVRNQ
jgi:hypothetical protein